MTCEVQQLLGNHGVRAVAMSATDGLMRGIKVVDLLAPYRRGGKIGLFGGVGERTREGNDLDKEMKESGVIH